MLQRIWFWLLKVIGLPRSSTHSTGDGRGVAQRQKNEVRYSLTTFEERSEARAAANQDGVAALVSSGEKRKWLILKCPCGCGQEIALNLMGSHSPRWRVDVTSAQSFSVHPSVDATSCGAHFWLRDGRVSWCE